MGSFFKNNFHKGFKYITNFTKLDPTTFTLGDQMNIKLITLASALAFTAAVAQDYEDEITETSTETTEYSEEAQEESEPEVTPVASAPVAAPAPAIQEEAPEAAPAAAENAGSFDILHGNSYNMVSSEAGASTINGDMNAVYKMNGRNLVYVEPTGSNAALAVTKGSTTYLLGFDAGRPNIVTAGFAMKNFGLALDFALDKEWSSEEEKRGDTKTTTDVSTTGADDLLRLKFGALLGSMDITANVYWLTFEEEVDTEETDDGTKTEDDNDKWDIGANVNVSNGPSAKSFFWSLGLDFLRHKNFQKTKMANTSTEITNPDSRIEIDPYFNFAVTLFEAPSTQVFLGTNTTVPVHIYDEIEDGTTTNNNFEIGLVTIPNILAQYSINENWMIYAEALYVWNVFGLRSESIEGPSYTDDTSIISMATNGTFANSGVRFSYQNLAVEASVGSNLNSEAWSGLIGNLGIFLIF